MHSLNTAKGFSIWWPPTGPNKRQDHCKNSTINVADHALSRMFKNGIFFQMGHTAICTIATILKHILKGWKHYTPSIWPKLYIFSSKLCSMRNLEVCNWYFGWYILGHTIHLPSLLLSYPWYFFLSCSLPSSFTWPSFSLMQKVFVVKLLCIVQFMTFTTWWK